MDFAMFWEHRMRILCAHEWEHLVKKPNENQQISEIALIIPGLSIYFSSVSTWQVNHGDTEATLGKSRRKECELHGYKKYQKHVGCVLDALGQSLVGRTTKYKSITLQPAKEVTEMPSTFPCMDVYAA